MARVIYEDNVTGLDVNVSLTNPLPVNVVAGGTTGSTSSSGAGASTSGYIGKTGGTNADFVVVANGTGTLSLTGLTGVSSFTSADIVSIIKTTSGGTTTTCTPASNTITASGTTVTVSAATFLTSDSISVYTSIAKPSPPAMLIITHWSPAHGTAVFASSKTITTSGFPFTVDDSNCRVVSVFYKSGASGTGFLRVDNGRDGIYISATNDLITVSGTIPTPFTSGDTFSVLISAVPIAQDVTLDANKVVVLNQRSSIEETILSGTGTSATGGTGVYYPSSLGKEVGNYEHLSLVGSLIGTTGCTLVLTVEISNLPDPSTDSNAWVQIYAFDAKNNTNVNSLTTVSTTPSQLAWFFDVCNFRWIRYKIVGSAAVTVTINLAERKF